MSSITIIDYGMGNLRSISKAIEFLGFSCEISSKVSDIEQASALILPGVGAFGAAMDKLNQLNLTASLQKAAQNKPLLGICLGMQLLFDTSHEKGEHTGLGLISGQVKSFELPAHFKVPHMGWNSVQMLPGAEASAQPSMFAEIPNESLFYFVHSFYVEPKDPAVVSGWCDYGKRFAASIQKDNLWATQFHPEKSGEIGLKILKNFCHLVF